MTEQNAHARTWEETVEPEQAKRKNWAGFVENEAVTFFEKFDLEKLTLGGRPGQQGQIAAHQEQRHQIEYTSSVVL